MASTEISGATKIVGLIADPSSRPDRS